MRTATGDEDIVALIELLKMAADHWPHPQTREVSQTDLFRQDQTLFEMWPEACRRTGVGHRQFPSGVISLWKHRMGSPN